MNVLLVQSYLGRKEELAIYPIGIAYLKLVLEEKHDVVIYDPNIDKTPFPAGLIHELKRTKPDIVGISLRNLDTTSYKDRFLYYKTMGPAIEAIKKVVPQAKITVGNTAFSMFAVEIMEKYPEIDYGIFLEGEESFPQLLENLNNPANVEGVYFREDGKIKFSGPNTPPDFAALPMLKRDPGIKENYPGPAAIGIQAKRGCPFRCSYCSYTFLSGTAVRTRPPEQVVDEMEYLVKEHGIKQVIFVDPVFNHPSDHAINICREIIRRGVKIDWGAWYNERYLTEELVELAIEAGCDYFSFSPDAISAKGLKALGKSLSPDDIEKVYQFAKKYKGMRVAFNFFAFPPGGGIGDFLKLVKFYFRCKFNLKKQLIGIGIGTIRIEPHTTLMDMVVKEGLIEDNRLTLLPGTDKEMKGCFYIHPKDAPYFYAYNILEKILLFLKKVIKKA